MDKVEAAVLEMIEGLSSVEYGISWAKPTANFSGEITRTWELSESVVAMDEEKVVADKIYEVVYEDLVKLVAATEVETERELKTFSINTAVLTRGTLDEKTLRYTFTLRFSYFMMY